MISLHSPCSENWDKMPSAEGGNYCGKCSKVVIDFTSFSNEELIAYLSERRDQNICGHLLAHQVVAPKPKYRLSRFLAALVFVFGSMLFSSCGVHRHQQVNGGISYNPKYDQWDGVKKVDSLGNNQVDTAK